MKYAKTCFVVGLMMALAVGALAAETKKNCKGGYFCPCVCY